MPVTLTYPGVYIEEIPSGVRTITGVATSITAFVGRALRGPTNDAITINSFGDFERIFGGLWLDSTLGFAVRDFYLNGGSQAIIVRLFHATTSEADSAAAKAAADAVAVEAKKGTNGADAKAKAKTPNDAFQAASGPAAEKTAAKAVFDAINALADTATAQEVAIAADAAAAAAAAAAAGPTAKLSAGPVKLKAAYEGKWGAGLRARVDLDNIPPTSPKLFNLTVLNAADGASERYLNLSTEATAARRADKVLEAESRLARWDGDLAASPPDLTQMRKDLDALALAPADAAKQDTAWAITQDLVTLAESKHARARKAYESAAPTDLATKKAALDTAAKAAETARQTAADAVSDGDVLGVADFLPANGETEKKGLFALERADLFNLLCIPPYTKPASPTDPPGVDVNLISAAAAYCEQRRAMLLVDPPKNWKDKATAVKEFKDTNDLVGTRSRNAALFFPRLRQPNPLRDNQMEEFAPCGAVAGVFARTDTQRGVWKAPAGLDATLVGVPALAVNLTDAENGELNPLGVNCLRAFPIIGRVVWGSRTLRGADQLADEYKYVPVRRLALFIEESLYRGTKWVVFEPNDEPLWAQIRLNVGAFMHNLFRQGAFQGSTPREAYFVKCDKESTTQNHVNLGIVNIIVGFAPLKPAEFVIVKLQQMAGQIQA